MKLSILIPVYNEVKTVEDVVAILQTLDIDEEIILVDDFSTDGTRDILKEKFENRSENIKVLYHEENKGKGAAIRTALAHATGDYVIVQDADMEYSPQDIVRMVEVALQTGDDAIYGSRFLKTWKSTSFPHFLVNRFLTGLTNILFGGKLTDMETCYKMVKTSVIQKLDIRAERFEFEPEVTAKLLKKGVKIKEIPVSYRGRSYDEGKKIGWRDGLEAVTTIIRLKMKL